MHKFKDYTMAQTSHRYQIKDKVGSGNFSSVHTAQDKITGSTVAVKIMKTHQNIAIKEAELLKRFDHPNIIKIFDFENDPFTGEARMILEHMPENTLELYENQQFGLSEEQVKCILFQSSLGLAYIHDQGIIHRDIKPENILINKQTAEIKLIDFGLAIQEKRTRTDYVATRWYRAPENLLGTKEYTTKIDVFSLACVAVELYLGSPLFPGADNIDQLYKIFNILGEPTEQTWLLGAKKTQELGFKMGDPRIQGSLSLGKILKTASPNFKALIQKMLTMNPKERISSKQILKDPYFNDIKSIVPPQIYTRFLKDFPKNEGKEKDSAKRKEIIESAENFINANRKKPIKKDLSEERKDRKDGKVNQLGKSYDLNNSQSLSTLNMALKDNNKIQTQAPKYNEIPLKVGRSFPQNLQTCGLSFRGFNPVKAPKISIKQVKNMKQSRQNSIDSREASLKNSINIDKSKSNANKFLIEPRQIKRRITDIRDSQTPDVKTRSIDKFNLSHILNVSRPVQTLKVPKSPGLQKSLALHPTEIYKSHRFIPFNPDLSSRMTRNLSQINPYSRRMGEFRPSNMQNMSNFPKQRPSPIGINLVHSPRKVSNKEVAGPEGKSIYTAPFHGKFQKLKLKPVPTPNYKIQNQRNDRSGSQNSSMHINQSKSQLLSTVELDRSGRSNLIPGPINVNPPQTQFSFPRRTHLHPNRYIPNDSKLKVPKSLEPSEIRESRESFKLVSPSGIRRQTIQVPEFRPSILLTENKEYREPRLTTKNNRNEKVVQNLSHFLNNRREDRNISINVNLSFMGDKSESGQFRRGRI